MNTTPVFWVQYYHEQLFLYLCGYSDRTCIQMALSHHGTSQGNERSGRKSKLISTQQSADYHVTPCPDLPINLKDDSPAQIIQYKGLMSLSYAQFPWQSGMFDA